MKRGAADTHLLKFATRHARKCADTALKAALHHSTQPFLGHWRQPFSSTQRLAETPAGQWYRHWFSALATGPCHNVAFQSLVRLLMERRLLNKGRPIRENGMRTAFFACPGVESNYNG